MGHGPRRHDAPTSGCLAPAPPNAKFRLHQTSNYGNGTTQVKTLLNTEGWSNQATWNSKPATSAPESPAENVQAGSGNVDQDVTALVRLWYTRNTNDWKPNIGFTSRLVDETDAEVRFDNQTAADPDDRPELRVTYVMPKVKVAFDTELGENFVPTAMPAGQTVKLPLQVTNTGGAGDQDFNRFIAGSTDYWKMGYRWFDAKGKPVVQTGFTATGSVDLPADVNDGQTSALFDLPVAAPPLAGHYSLRLDLVHMVDGVALWASDWAKPSKYYARAKYDPDDTSDTRWVGTSVVERDDFGVGVTEGAGDAAGELRWVGLADGTAVGINLWSKGLRIEGTSGLGWDDLGLPVGLDFQYDSLRKDVCTGVLKACGWTTSLDEHWEAGANGADYVYQDAAGNRHLVTATGVGQLVSGAPARLERTRVTLLQENTFSGWTGTTPVSDSAQSLPSGGSSYRIDASNTTGTATTSFPKADLDSYPYLSFGVRGSTTTGAAIGFKVRNESKDTEGWLAYTAGTDFAISGVTKIALGGSITGVWKETLQRNLRVDAYQNGFGGTQDRYTVTGLKFWGKGGSGSAFFDAVRFEGRREVLFEDIEPAWTANGANGSVETGDKVSGTGSIKALGVHHDQSPNCANCENRALFNHPFASWSWKKVGGSTVAIVFQLDNSRTGAAGKITYYAGPSAPAGVTNPVKIADEAPTEWTKVTRNLLDDARQTLGWYKDSNDGGSAAPTGGPVPDDATLTGYRLVGVDGSHALFDLAIVSSLTELGEQYGATTGDDYLVTLAGGSSTRSTSTATWCASRTPTRTRSPSTGLAT